MLLAHVSLGSSKTFSEDVSKVVMRCIVAASIILLGGCPNRQNVPCNQDSNCDLASGGACLGGPSNDHWCAYPDSTCPSGFRYSDLDVGDGVSNQCTGELPPTDAGTDAGIDAPGFPAFDVAYVNEFRNLYAIEQPLSAWLLVINRDASATLSMSTLLVKSIADDHPTALVRATATPSAASIGASQAGGALTPQVRGLIVDTQLVTETRVDVDSDYVGIEVLQAPEGTYDIHVDLMLSLNNRDVNLPITVHIVPGMATWHDAIAATRKTIFKP